MKLTPILPLVTLTLSLAVIGCDSKEEQLRKKGLEQHADNLESAAKVNEKQAERRADEIEKQGREKAGLDKKAADETATIVRKEGERRAEALKENADAVRDRK